MRRSRLDTLRRGDPRFGERGEIARGGQAAVYRVHDPDVGRDVALKRLASGALPPIDLERFLDEVQITGQLEHPNIVPVHDVGIDADGRMFMVMRLIRGRTLREEVARLGDARLTPDHLGDMLGILMKVADALAFAHERGVVHRDLKPANVMVAEHGQVYVMDWGIAHVFAPDAPASVRLTDGPREEDPLLDEIVGTPAWMAPEQAAGIMSAIGPATDVFQLGALLYFVLTGRAPYGKLTVDAALRRARVGQYASIEELGLTGLPKPLVEIARRAMSPDPRHRYSSATAFRMDLEQFVRGSWGMVPRRVAAGDDVIRQGEFGSTAFVIRSGRCAAYIDVAGRRELVREMGPGEVFGETAVFADTARSATIVALTELELLEVDRAALERGLGLHSWMGVFVRELANRFLELESRTRGTPAPVRRR